MASLAPPAEGQPRWALEGRFGTDRAELSPQQAVFGGLEALDVVPPGHEGVECAHAAVGLGTGGEKPAGATSEVRAMGRGERQPEGRRP
ncbi:hypothetical protein [Streptomyces sp. NPDC001450]